MIDKKQPIIVKKVFHGGHGHHGGAWKVAFADFVTAMMAFFMLMWLMGSTTTEERAAISEYFDNPSMSEGLSSSPAPSAVQGPGGASTSLISLGGAMEMNKEKEKEKEKETKTEEERETEKEKVKFDGLMESLREAIEKSEALQPFKDQLLLDVTAEGLRIQIVDKENRPMFASGDAKLKHYTYDILKELSYFMSAVPNRISLSGHTDASRFQRENYGNWELSADRANAARRVLTDNGVAESKIGRVVGLASSIPFDKANPQDPVNRRIAIIILNKKTEEALVQSETVTEAQIRAHGGELPANTPLPEPGSSPIQLPTLPLSAPSAPQKSQSIQAPPIAPPLPPISPPAGSGASKEPGKSETPAPKTAPKPKAAEPVMDLPMEYL